MQRLLELYEMVSINQGSLSEEERAQFLKAQLALAMFARAMQAFRVPSVAKRARAA